MECSNEINRKKMKILLFQSESYMSSFIKSRKLERIEMKTEKTVLIPIEMRPLKNENIRIAVRRS